MASNRTLVWVSGFVAVAAITAVYVAFSKKESALERKGIIGIYRKATYDIPEKFDPARGVSTAEHTIANLMYEGLYSIDAQLELKPVLAELFELSPDGRDYKFFLRRDRKFHDGTPVTAEAVRASMSKLLEETHPANTHFKRIASIKAIADDQLVISLREPFPSFLALMAAPFAKVSKEVPGSPYFMGSGKYAFGKIEKDSDGHRVLRLEAVPSHPDQSYIQRIELVHLSENEAMAGLEKGVIHDSALLPSRSGLLKSAPRVVETNSPAAQTWLIAFNNSKPPTSDRLLRNCLVATFKREEFHGKFIPDHTIASGYIPPTLLGSTDTTTVDYKSRPVTAEDCQGFSGLELTLDYPDVMTDGAAMCTSWSQTWSEKGIRIKCNPLDFGRLIQRIESREAELSFLGMSLDLPDVEYFVNTFESGHGFNLANYSSPTIDANLRAARIEQDRLKKMVLFQAIDRELSDYSVTLNLSYPRHISYRHACLDGFAVSMAGEQYIDYRQVFIKQGCKFDRDFDTVRTGE